MCLVIVAQKNRPTADEIEAAAWSNPDGIGIGWFSKETGLPEWRKNLTTDEAVKLSKKTPLPFALHLRFATHGGRHGALTHPFPITRHAGTAYRGTAKSLVMHNGVWPQYLDHVTNAHMTGPVSDTRVLAHVLGITKRHNRHKVATKIAAQAGKLAILEDGEIQTYGTWTDGSTDPDTTTGCLYSNTNHLIGTQCATQCLDYHQWDQKPLWTGYMPDNDENLYKDAPVPSQCEGCDMWVDHTNDELMHGYQLCEDCAEMLRPTHKNTVKRWFGMD
jgi:predicted glutamine amidotransferase